MANEKAKYIIGTLVLILLIGGSFLISLGEKTRIQLDKDKTVFYVNENGKWVVSGKEYLKLYDGKKIIKPLKANITLEKNQIGNTVYLIRTVPYANGASIVDTYLFDGAVDDVELFPISHQIEVKRGVGLTLQYEARNLQYKGPALKTVSSPQSFGRNMELRWDSSSYSQTLSKSGTLTLKYLVSSSSETYEIRLFDPLQNESFTDPETGGSLYRYTNLSLSNVQGQVDFSESFVTGKTGTGIANSFQISKNKIRLDKTKCRECDVPAQLLFSDTGLDDPQIFHNGIWQENMPLVKVGDDDYQISVNSWSEWTLDQGTFEGTFNGTTLYGGSNIVSKGGDAVLILEFDDNIAASDTLTDTSLFLQTPGIGPYHYGPNTDNNSGHVSGKIDGAVRFDGVNNRISMPFSASTLNSLNYTVTLWVNTSTVIAVNEAALLGEGRSGILLSNTGIPKCRAFTTASVDNQIGGANEADNNTFVFVACVYVNGSVQNTTTYVNGFKTASGEAYPGLLVSTLSYLGENINTVVGSPFAGTIDEFKFFNRSLSDAEILQMYNSEVTGVSDPSMDTNNLSVEYQFNETQGYTLFDNRAKNYGVMDGYHRGFWNATGGVFGGAAWQFGGNLSYFNFSDNTQIPNSLAGNASFAFWMKTTNITTLETDIFGYGSYGNKMSLLTNSTHLLLKDNISAANITVGSVGYSVNQYSLVGISIYGNGTKRFYINNTLIASNAASGTTAHNITSDIIVIANTNKGNQRRSYEGFIDDFKAWNRSLELEDFSLLYAQKNTYRFKPSGNYITVVHNVNDTVPGASGSKWFNFTFLTADSSKDNFTVKGKASDNCATLGADPFSEVATRNNTNQSIFHFTNLLGRCAQFEFQFDSNRNYSDLVTNYTLQSKNVDCQVVNSNITLIHHIAGATLNNNNNGCLIINSTNVQIDFAGFKIIGNGSLSKGIVNSGFANLTLINPSLSNFTYSIAATNVAIGNRSSN